MRVTSKILPPSLNCWWLLVGERGEGAGGDCATPLHSVAWFGSGALKPVRVLQKYVTVTFIVLMWSILAWDSLTQGVVRDFALSG